MPDKGADVVGTPGLEDGEGVREKFLGSPEENVAVFGSGEFQGADFFEGHSWIVPFNLFRVVVAFDFGEGPRWVDNDDVVGVGELAWVARGDFGEFLAGGFAFKLAAGVSEGGGMILGDLFSYGSGFFPIFLGNFGKGTGIFAGKAFFGEGFFAEARCELVESVDGLSEGCRIMHSSGGNLCFLCYFVTSP